MATRNWLLALAVVAAAAPAAAMQDSRTAAAPAGTAETRYCMRIEWTTGSRIERIKCWTREKWAEQGVDVDRDWAEEGVRTIG